MCKNIASKWTPLILEVRPGHFTYNKGNSNDIYIWRNVWPLFWFLKVEQKFKRAWKGSGVPSIKKVYKIFENKSFLPQFDSYRFVWSRWIRALEDFEVLTHLNCFGRRRVGNEVSLYHGTSRRCTLGSRGNTRPCPSTTCALCSILRTSFRISQSGP